LKDVVFQVSRQPIPFGAATEKALSPMFRLVLGTTKSQLLDERSDDREGMSEAGVNRLSATYK